MGSSYDSEALSQSNESGDSNSEPMSTCTCGVVQKSISQHQQDVFILEQLYEKLVSGCSRKDLENRLKKSRVLGFDFPCKWNQILKFLKSLGYSDPRHFKVCVANDHSVAFPSEERCPICNKAGSDCIDYFVMGMSFENWFDTEEKCDRLLGTSHWKERNEWFGKHPHEDIDMIELWHGERFRELSYFWDSTVLSLYPAICQNCRKVIPTKNISASPNFHMGSAQELSIKCPHCHKVQSVVPKYARGDPRNQAIILHFDGWNPQSTSSKHGIAAISIAKGCMQKSERAGNREVQVYSFIPSSQLPRDCPHKYDGFLQPLLEDICSLYIDGKCVYYAKRIVDGVPSPAPEEDNYCVLRVIPLLLTAYLKAHAELGLVKSGGYSSCRRCTVPGVYCNGSVHYGDFQYRFKNPYPPKTAETNRRNGKILDSASLTSDERKDLLKHSGVTGESLLYILYDLCQFDPVKDAVIDCMHAICLNLIATELKGRLLADPGKGGVLQTRDLAQALIVQWTTELKDGRIPEVCGESIGYHRKKLVNFYHCKKWIYITFYHGEAIYNLFAHYNSCKLYHCKM